MANDKKNNNNLKYVVLKNSITVAGSKIYVFSSTHENFNEVKALIESGNLKEEAQVRSLAESSKTYVFDDNFSVKINSSKATIKNKDVVMEVHNRMFCDWIKDTLSSCSLENFDDATQFLNVKKWFNRASCASSDKLADELLAFQNFDGNLPQRIDDSGYMYKEVDGSIEDLLHMKFGDIRYTDRHNPRAFTLSVKDDAYGTIRMVVKHDPAGLIDDKLTDYYGLDENVDSILHLLLDYAAKNENNLVYVKNDDLDDILYSFKENCIFDDVEERKEAINNKIALGLFADDAFIDENSIKFEEVLFLLFYLQTAQMSLLH